MTRNLIALLLGASALTACAAGPDYRPPATPTSAAAPFIGAASPAVAPVTGAGGEIKNVTVRAHATVVLRVTPDKY